MATNAPATNLPLIQRYKYQKITIASLNIGRGLGAKIDEIKEMILTEKIGILCVQETDCRKDELTTYQIPNFEQYTYDLDTQEKVREVIYIHKSVKAKVRKGLMNKDTPSIWIEMINQYSKNILLCGIYREWKQLKETTVTMQAQTERIDIIGKQISLAESEHKHTILIGDINLCMKTWMDKSYPWYKLAEQW